MIKKQIRFSIILSVLLAGVVFLAGCTGSDTGTTVTTQPTKTTQPATSQEVDCGVSSSMMSDTPVTEIDFNADAAFMCLGKSLLDGCKSSKAMVQTTNAGELGFGFKKNDDGDCTVRIDYGDASQIPVEGQKKYANKYIECPIDLDAVKTAYSGKTDEEGSLVFSIYFAMGFKAIEPNTKCTGTAVGL